VKQNKSKPKATEDKLRALSTLNQQEYDDILSVFSTLIDKKIPLYTLKGKKRVSGSYKESVNSSLYGCKKKLDFILMYMKENPNQAYHGYVFGISQSKVSEWVSYLSPVLEEALLKLGFMPQVGYCYRHHARETDYLLVDVTERQVSRRSDYEGQREEYSGKKKLHTVKNLAITTAESYIVYLSPSYEGTVHDKAIWDAIDIEQAPLNLLADLGFMGIEKDYPNAILPYKKPKSKELSDLQKKINHGISKVRVRVEHAFSGIKRLKIIRNKIRLKTYEVRDRMIRIAAALHNLRVTYRNL
jgi:hypothetical protein